MATSPAPPAALPPGPTGFRGAALEDDGREPGGPGERAHRSWWPRRHWPLLAVLLTALAARCWQVVGELPVLHHPDEPGNTNLIESMVADGQLDPDFFNYPSLFLYLQAAVSPDGPLLGWLIPGDVAEVPVRLAMGVSYAPSVTTMLLHRGLTVVLGVAVVLVTWLIARRVFGGQLAPAVAAGLAALSPNLVEHSQFVTPDMLAVLMAALAVLASLHLLDSGSTRAHVLAGLLVGLSASSKYNAALVALAVVTASMVHAVRRGRLRPTDVGRLVLSGVVAGVAFLSTTPFAVLNSETFLADLEFERQHYATGHVGMEGGTTAFYASLLAREETLISLLGAVGILVAVVAVRGYRGPAAVLLAFPVGYIGFVSMMIVRNDRTIMIVLPMFAVFAGFAVQWVRDGLRNRLRRPAPRTAQLFLSALLVGAVAVGLPAAVSPHAVHDARVEAAGWVAANLPVGSTVVVESYGPWVDPADHAVVGIKELVSGEIPTGADYVIASEAMYGRYVGHADRFPREAAAYRRLFAAWVLVREFVQPGQSVRVYRVPGGA